MTTPISPELSFDGFGINGPTQYRDRLCTFNRNVPSALTPAYSEEQIQHYGHLFASAPQMFDYISRKAAEGCPEAQSMMARTALAKARGMKGGE